MSNRLIDHSVGPVSDSDHLSIVEGAECGEPQYLRMILAESARTLSSGKVPEAYAEFLIKAFIQTAAALEPYQLEHTKEERRTPESVRRLAKSDREKISRALSRAFGVTRPRGFARTRDDLTLAPRGVWMVEVLCTWGVKRAEALAALEKSAQDHGKYLDVEELERWCRQHRIGIPRRGTLGWHLTFDRRLTLAVLTERLVRKGVAVAKAVKQVESAGLSALLPDPSSQKEKADWFPLELPPSEEKGRKRAGPASRTYRQLREFAEKTLDATDEGRCPRLAEVLEGPHTVDPSAWDVLEALEEELPRELDGLSERP